MLITQRNPTGTWSAEVADAGQGMEEFFLVLDDPVHLAMQ
jgi:hypothetical protein